MTLSSLPCPANVHGIRLARPADAAAICSIYNHYIATSHCTCEESPVTIEEMEKRIADVNAQLCWFVHEGPGEGIVGYAYATPWRTRSGYRYSVETTVYVRDGCAGRGIGTRLTLHLIDHLKARGVHALMAGIAQPNEASVALHQAAGYEKVAHFREVGFKFGRWIDVAYWERVLA